MSEGERSIYCRERGLYPKQLDAWKTAFEAMDASSTPAGKAQLTAGRQKSRKLDKELLRKEAGTGRGGGVADAVKKGTGHPGQRRGPLVPELMKQIAVMLADEAVAAGARQHKACGVRSFSRPSVSHDNPYSKALRCLWQKPVGIFQSRAMAATVSRCVHAVQGIVRQGCFPPSHDAKAIWSRAPWVTICVA